MALPMPPNVSVNVYRTANPAAPYTLGALAEQTTGYLKPAAANGRFGTALYLKWTHILYIPPNVDVRDAYNSQLDPARNNNNADTVVLADSVSANKTAYYVVYVEVVARNAAQAHQRVYLDRFTPNAWPTDSI
jgi:hypothetical protein